MMRNSGSTIARPSSGSSASSNSVEPLRSANSAVTILRSPGSTSSAGSARDPTLAPLPCSAAASLAPQLAQNLLAGGFSAPQRAQGLLSGAPHSPQKRWPAGLSVLQLLHF